METVKKYKIHCMSCDTDNVPGVEYIAKGPGDYAGKTVSFCDFCWKAGLSDYYLKREPNNYLVMKGLSIIYHILTKNKEKRC